jgi:hypothetical protein
VAVWAILAAGCCGRLKQENARLREENMLLISQHHPQAGGDQAQLLYMQQRNECLLRHSDAKHSCEMIFRSETNPIAFQNLVFECLAQKGFPNGIDSCP